MAQIYVGIFSLENGLMKSDSPEAVIFPQDFRLPQAADSFAGVGSGFLYQDLFTPTFSLIDQNIFPHAKAAIPLALSAFSKGQGVSADKALPVYLRDNIVQN